MDIFYLSCGQSELPFKLFVGLLQVLNVLVKAIDLLFVSLSDLRFVTFNFSQFNQLIRLLLLDLFLVPNFIFVLLPYHRVEDLVYLHSYGLPEVLYSEHIHQVGLGVFIKLKVNVLSNYLLKYYKILFYSFQIKVII